MASMFVRLHVADFEKWKAAFDEFEPVRRQATITGHSVHRDADDPSVVIIAFRVQDIVRARQFTASDDLRQIMERAGVVGPPEFWFAEDIEDKSY